jgi:hypothetical protein
MSFVVSPPSLPEAPQVSVFGVREIDKCSSLELQVCAHPANRINMHVFLSVRAIASRLLLVYMCACMLLLLFNM